jgi:hypothetical protein
MRSRLLKQHVCFVHLADALSARIALEIPRPIAAADVSDLPHWLEVLYYVEDL